MRLWKICEHGGFSQSQSHIMNTCIYRNKSCGGTCTVCVLLREMAERVNKVDVVYLTMQSTSYWTCVATALCY